MRSVPQQTAHMAVVHMGPTGVKRHPTHADKAVIDNLSVLAEYGDENARIKETQKLIVTLKDKQHLQKGALCGDLVYAVGRLVRGLASSRQLARLGFSIALCQVLRHLPEITVTYVLEVIQKEFGKLGQGHPTKGENTNILLGKIFAYLALIQSRRLFSEQKEIIGKVTEDLYKASKKKSQIRLLCVSGLVQIVEQVKVKVFGSTIWPAVQADFRQGWGECNPDTLLLILKASQTHREIVGDFLEEHWLDRNLISEKNFTFLADIVKTSTSVQPHIHPVVTEILSVVVKQGEDIVKFWKTVVGPLFESTHHRKVLGLHMFCQLFPHIDVKTQLKKIMTHGVYELLYNCRQGKNNLLLDQITHALSLLTSLAKTTDDHKIQLVILRSLFTGQKDFNFDNKTRTSTVSTIINNLLPEAAVKMGKDLLKTSLVCEMPADATKATCAFKELGALVTHSNTTVAWQLEILQYLFLHGFFVIKKPSSDVPHCEGAGLSGEYSPRARDSARQFFCKTLGKIVTFSTHDHNRVTQFGRQLDVLYQLAGYVQTLLEKEDVVTLQDGVMSEEAVEEWSKVTALLEKINRKRLSEEKIGNSHAFELLFLYTGFDLFMETDKAIEVLEDLHVCYEKATQKRKSKASEDEPAWIEVLTELLLSMMSKGSKLSRTIAKMVFTSLGDHVTVEALGLIGDILQQDKVSVGTDDDEEGPVALADDMDNIDEEEESDESESDEDEDDKQDDKDDVDEEEDSEADDSEDSGVEEEDMPVDEELKKSLKSALGKAAVDSDEEQDEDDLSDSEMFKLDDVLAQAFRRMKKGKKKEEKERARELLNLKLRVLDMLEAFLKKHVSVIAVKALLFPLLDLLEVSSHRAEEKDLNARVSTVLSSMCKMKKISQGIQADRDEMLDILKKLLEVSSSVSDKMVTMVSKATILVIGLLLNVEVQVDPSPVKTRAKAKQKTEGKQADVKNRSDYEEQVVHLMQTALSKTFQKREGASSPKFFLTVLEGYPVLFWPVVNDLLAVAGNTEKKIFLRTKAFNLMSVLICKQCASNLEDTVWQEFLVSLTLVITQAVTYLSASDFKPRFVQELMVVLTKLLSVSAADAGRVVDVEIVKKLESLKPHFNMDMKRLYNKLTSLHPDFRREKKKQKQKKRKHEKDSEMTKTTTDDTDMTHEPSPAKKKHNEHSEQNSSDKPVLESGVLDKESELETEMTPAGVHGKKSQKQAKRKSNLKTGNSLPSSNKKKK